MVPSNGYKLRVPLFLVCFILPPLLTTGVPIALSEYEIYTPEHISFWYLAVTSAGFFGIGPYLIAGFPVMFQMSRRVPPTTERLALGGLFANMLTPILVLTFWLIFDLLGIYEASFRSAIYFTAFCFIFGLIFATLWGAMVGTLYTTLDTIFPARWFRRAL